MKTMIDFSLINLPEFFGCVEATNTKKLKSNTFKTLRTYLHEKSFEKWSNGQLKYIGDCEDGKDFIDFSGIRYEMKGALELFNKNGSCKKTVLINKRPATNDEVEQKPLKKEDIQKTFDYMILVDTKNMSLGYTDWDTVYSRTECCGAGATFKLCKGDYEILFSNVKPSKKSITPEEILDKFQEIL